MSAIRRFAAPEAPDVDLLCFPHAGGRADFYEPWQQYLPLDVALSAVEYPGHGVRAWETPADSIGELADDVVRALSGHPATPLVLFGHSMGALVAFEVASRLTPPPTVLIVSSMAAAHLAHLKPSLPSSDDDVWQHACSLGGTPERLHRNRLLRRLLLPSLRHDYGLVNSYRSEAGVPLACPVVACRAVDDPITESSQMAAWAELTTGPFELKSFSGGHFYLSTAWHTLAETAIPEFGAESNAGEPIPVAASLPSRSEGHEVDVHAA